MRDMGDKQEKRSETGKVVESKIKINLTGVCATNCFQLNTTEWVIKYSVSKQITNYKRTKNLIENFSSEFNQ